MITTLQRKWRVKRIRGVEEDNNGDGGAGRGDSQEIEGEKMYDYGGAYNGEIHRSSEIEAHVGGEDMVKAGTRDTTGGVYDGDNNSDHTRRDDEGDDSRTDGVNICCGDDASEDGDHSGRGPHSDADWQWHENLLRVIYRNLQQLDILQCTGKGVDRPLKDESDDGVIDDADSVDSTREQIADEVLNFDNPVYRFWREADVRTVDPSRCLMSFVCIGDDSLLGEDEGTHIRTKDDLLGEELALEGYHGSTQTRATVFRRVREISMSENTSSRMRRITSQLRDAWAYIRTQKNRECNITTFEDGCLLLPGPIMWYGACAEGIKEAMPWARETFCFSQILQCGLVSEEKLRRCFVRAQLLKQSVRTKCRCSLSSWSFT